MRIGIISGYFNPLHIGHLDYIEGARQYCDFLYVIVNNDEQVKIKGSTPFMDEKSRERIVKALVAVDRTLIAIDKDGTVVKSIEKIYQSNRDDLFVDSFIFMNGGDQKSGTIPEEEYCQANNIRTIFSVGGDKTQSSSSLIEDVHQCMNTEQD
jgi:D-beta-D-heptose 7-phosphate kinase/D-beta-D-heptose 1-phosphate adenosyltransferase